VHNRRDRVRFLMEPVLGDVFWLTPTQEFSMRVVVFCAARAGRFLSCASRTFSLRLPRAA